MVDSGGVEPPSALSSVETKATQDATMAQYQMPARSYIG